MNVVSKGDNGWTKMELPPWRNKEKPTRSEKSVAAHDKSRIYDTYFETEVHATNQFRRGKWA
jgi:hypothetical protein